MDLLLPSIILILHCLPLCRSQNGSFYYDTCAPLLCGSVTVAFPFTSSEPFCGLPGYAVSCDRSTSVPTITLSGTPYQVHTIYRSDCLITVSDSGLLSNLRSNSCDSLPFPSSSDFSPLQLPPWNTTLNLSVCPRDGLQIPGNAAVCPGANQSLYVLQGDVPTLPASCSRAALPVQTTSLLTSNATERDGLLSVVGDGFPLQWANQTVCWGCEAEGGRCGYNTTTERVVCYCNNDGCHAPGPDTTGGTRSSSWKIILAAVVAAAAVAVAAGALAFFKLRRRALSSSLSGLNTRSMSRSQKVDVQEFINNYRSTLTTEYSYKDVKRITDNFKEKLGGGGYGSVYKGTLPNGQLVAAKLLQRSTDDGRDFVSEVATIGTTHHVNIIHLLGFCCDGPRRALIYEFMPRGSLGDLMSNDVDVRRSLGMAKLVEIARGVGRGLEYLHQGCDKRILHLDIKPQNILLDEGLHPKISDFGLAKSYSRGERSSAAVVTAVRGTVGYIAPEVFMRNLGGVSHKSDVYSYGMLLLEMAMGRCKHEVGDADSDVSSKDYFANSLYEQLNRWRDMELDDSVVVVEEEEEVSLMTKMVMVGLWCIQTKPVNRPSVSAAVEMLTGRVECIEMPPKPLLFSPPKSGVVDLPDNNRP